MGPLDITIVVFAFLLIFLLFLQPLSQDKLAGFLSGSSDVLTSYQKVKERGTTKVILNVTIVFFFIMLILLIAVRATS